MKKMSLFLACVLLFSLLSVSAYAADVETDVPPVDIEEYTYLANAWAGLARSSGNWYDVTGGAGSAHGTMYIQVTVEFQKFGDDGWDTLQTWYGDGYFDATAGGERYISSSGTYRTKMYAEIYREDGTLGETEIAYSDHLIIR